MSSKIRIILGCMTFGPAHSSTARVASLEDTKTIFNYFHDRGYGEIDTARVKDGQAQPATRLISVLKSPRNAILLSLAEIVTLARDHGLVRPTIYQGRYNAMSRDIEDELIPALRHYGLDLVVFSPLAGGLFSGKYTKQADIPASGRFSPNTAQGALYRSRYFKDVYWDAIQHIQPLAEKHGLTLLEIALRWLVHHSQLKFARGKELIGDGIIIGVSSLKHLEDNINAIEVILYREMWLTP
ncbi:NADP-dependent oxidoreductase domain-containing protein [Lipomyces doorenjongii]|uniref:NADP-dependent oxidoreductase domain-containing protein n=1 Tax=Lipomyces doorenjongii TaxID=383834 RepID=UPI0034CF6C5F